MALTAVPAAQNAEPGRWQVGQRLLNQPAPHSHIVQFYENDDFLINAVAQYCAAGLRVGEPVVVVATPAHRQALVTALYESGVDVGRICDNRRLIMGDARETLSRFMVDGLPDAHLFKSVVGGMMDELRAAGGPANIRAFGEMVDLLWRDGNRQAALMLEQLWNDLAQRHQFSLLCGYVMDNFRQGEHAVLFEEVCQAHSHVIPTESYAQIEDSDERLREVSLLQQRARALETEIAQRKDVERALREALKVRDEFLSIASHELKTPLTTIHLQVQSLLRLIKDDEPRVGQRLARTARNVDRIAGLVEQLLDVSRLTAGPLVLETGVFDLASIAQEAIDQLAEEAERAGCPISLLAAQPTFGHWDGRRLVQVVVNLLSNAVKYGRGRPIDVLIEAGPETARLTVRDRGMGIAVPDQTRVFERFERAVPAEHYAGLGLGLWIVRQVVQAHGGTVDLQSEPGQGATFVVALPLT